MKKQLPKILIINIALLLFGISAYAQTTYVWTGAAGSAGVGDWATPGNWTVGGAVAADYPGHAGTTDIVDIGVPGVAGPSDTTFFFTNQPTLAVGATVNIASLTFGNNNAPTGTISLATDGTGSTITNTTAGIITLTVNGTLNVSGTVLQMHSATGGGANSATTTPPTHTAGTTTTAEYTSLLGAGTLHCGFLTLGDQTLPSHGYVSNVTVFLIGGIVTNLNAVAPATVTNPVESNVTINIDHDFTMNSVSSSQDDAPVGLPTGSPAHNVVVVSRNSDSRVIFYQGTFNIGGMFNMVNNNATPAYPLALFQANYKPNNKFGMRPESSPRGSVTHNANFFYGGPFISFGNPLSSDYANTVNKIDFYDATGGASPTFTTVVNYNGNNNQVVYSDNDSSHVDIGAYVYSQLIISGSGVKTALGNGGPYAADFTPGLTVNQTLTVTNTGPAGSTTTFDLSPNNTNLWLNSNYVTTANTIVKTGSGFATLSGGFYTNAGTSNFGTGLVTFNSPKAISMTGNGTSNFTNVLFKNGSSTVPVSTVTMAGGKYNILSTGVMTLALATGATSLAVTPTGTGALTFKSDANGSATLANLPANCSVGGTAVNVERYISGGVGGRGYRLLSSPVNTGTTPPDGTGNKIFTLNYIKLGSWLSGTTSTAGGFDLTGGANNPTLYLYRENLTPSFTTFLNSNFRGVMDINLTPGYDINSDAVNSDPGLHYLPIGNGYLFFFRGSRSTVNPFLTTTVANAATLTATGTLNQGAITVHGWYTQGSANLNYTTLSGDATIEGANLVGNPYPAAIDWNNFSASNPAAGIYGPNVAPFVYQLHPGNQAGSGNYGIWDALNGPTNGGSNIIASGEGFFVFALPPTATNPTSSLTFTEGAKINTSTGPTLYMAKMPAIAKVAPQFLRLKMALDTINTDESLISFRSTAKPTFDMMEDAPYRSGTGKVNMGSYSTDHRLLAINSMPLAKNGQIIPLKVGATASGTYSLTANEITGIPQLYDIWLKDAFTKDSVNLRKTATYSFTINLGDTTTFGSRRFSIVLSQDPALAYKLISFDASKVDNKKQVEVTWKTTNEQNYTHFTVQRSTNEGKTFDVIGSVTSNGQGTYSFLDKDPEKGDNLYELKQEDFNNAITLSNVVKVQFTDHGNDNVRLCVYPNPAANHISVIIDPRSQESVTYKIKISNSMGTIVRQVVTKQTNWEDNVSQLFTGTYLVQVVNEKDNSLVGQTKFVKL